MAHQTGAKGALGRGRVTVVNKLPAGVTPTHVYSEGGGGEIGRTFPGFLTTCSFASQMVTCTYAGPLLTYERLMIAISVKVTPGDGNGENELSLSGGGATSAVLRRALALGDSTPSFGVENYELTPEEEGGAVDTQAGSHPFQLTTTLTLNTNAVPIFNSYLNETLPEVRPLAYTKDMHFNLPPGLVGNPTPLPKCNMYVFLERKLECPANTIIGVSTPIVINSNSASHVPLAFSTPLYSLEPSVGEPARFGFQTQLGPVILDTSVRTGGDYGVVVTVPDIPEAGFIGTHVIVRAKIEVNPENAALTITSDATGPYAIPQIIDGIPLQIKHVNVSINRPDFTFNPTNCAPQEIGGSLTSGQGTVSALHVPFQVTNCAVLKFKPLFSVSTNGKTSRKNGASLNVKLTYPKAPFGTQANIGKVKVDLPKQLPSRLTTLQKACPASTFEANPAACPSDSRIGTATATTPVLPVDLVGPAYFVSHGGAKFPELIVSLSGEGVTVYLHGETFISKEGITSSTFRTIPDVPIGVFELSLPEGPDSALAANGNLCKSKLTMPTIFVGANGVNLKQSTPIAVTGCPKKATVKKAAVKKAKGKGKHKKK